MTQAPDAPAYVPRDPRATALFRAVEGEVDAFTAVRDLPAFVEREFKAFLNCGLVENGFVRLFCDSCQHNHLLPLSCKKRGFCPSCGGRRMAESAANLVDHIIPHVPVRQWVLTLPFPLRLRCAYDSALRTRILGAHIGGIFAEYRRRARALGIRDAQCGSVTAIQRANSDLRLNPHAEYLALSTP